MKNKKEFSRGTMDSVAWGDKPDTRIPDGEEEDMTFGAKGFTNEWGDEPDWRDTGEMGG